MTPSRKSLLAVDLSTPPPDPEDVHQGGQGRGREADPGRVAQGAQLLGLPDIHVGTSPPPASTSGLLTSKIIDIFVGVLKTKSCHSSLYFT